MSELALWLRRQAVSVEIMAASTDSGRDMARCADPIALLGQLDEPRLPARMDVASRVVVGLAYRLRRLAPAVVHCFAPSDALAARIAGIPYVLRVDSRDMDRSHAGEPAAAAALASAIERARMVVCPDRAAALAVAQCYSCPVELIPDGLDMARWHLASSNRMPGRIFIPMVLRDPSMYSSALVLRQAVDLLRSGAVGTAPSSPVDPQGSTWVRSAVPEPASVSFMHGDHDDGRQYSIASVTCVPGGTSFACRRAGESLACGTPVALAGDAGACSIVDGEVGSLFVPHDPQSCARAIKRCLALADDPELAVACRKRAADLDWSVIGPQLVELYGRAARDGGNAGIGTVPPVST